MWILWWQGDTLLSLGYMSIEGYMTGLNCPQCGCGANGVVHLDDRIISRSLGDEEIKKMIKEVLLKNEKTKISLILNLILPPKSMLCPIGTYSRSVITKLWKPNVL